MFYCYNAGFKVNFCSKPYNYAAPPFDLEQTPLFLYVICGTLDAAYLWS